MRTILIPVDFTLGSYVAAYYAANLAQTTRAKLFFFHSFYVPVSNQEFYISPDVIQNAALKAKKQLTQFIEEVKHAIPNGALLETSSEVSAGHLQTMLSQLILNHQVDLIVMATHIQKNELIKMVTGSQALSTIKQSEVPVLVIPDSVTFRKIRTVGFTTSLEDIDNIDVLWPVLQISWLTDIMISFVVVVPDGEGKHSKEQLEEYLLLENTFKNTPHKLEVIENQNITEGILDYVDKNKPDILVTMPKKHTFMDSLTNKSVTESLIKKINIPVLCLQE
jgi:nucleotide-binding universal stress UspA family protein